jgi:hypothetical protein
MNLMQKFINDRRKLDAYSRVKYCSSFSPTYLFIDDPRILAGFAGYLKFQVINKWPKSKVFYRGQAKNHKSMIPKLLRDSANGVKVDNNRINIRYEAYRELAKETPNIYYKSYRFERENLDPILQHYGIHTHWLDLVDNLYTAIWFATRQTIVDRNGQTHYTRSNENHGWIYFIATRNDDGEDLEYYDLRERHSSLSLRLHVQHGISTTRKNVEKWTLTNRFLDNFIIATVKFPNSELWDLKGDIFKMEYLFPNGDFDNTYKYLKREGFEDLLKRKIKKFNLEESELGEIIDYAV